MPQPKKAPTTKPSLITEELLDALAERESHSDPLAIGDKQLDKKAYGMFQMREPAFQDVQRLRPKASQGLNKLEEILGNPALQRQLASAYLSILDEEYGLDTLEDILAAYNAGIGKVRKKAVPQQTKAYVQDILQLMQGQSAEELPAQSLP